MSGHNVPGTLSRVRPAPLPSASRASGHASLVSTVQTGNEIDFRITFFADDVFRIQAAPGGAFADPENDPAKAQIVVVGAPEEVALTDEDGADAIEFTHQENRFDAYYFVGDDFKRVIDLYTRFTGRSNFVPIWALELGDGSENDHGDWVDARLIRKGSE